jgi:hypothetical protein
MFAYPKSQKFLKEKINRNGEIPDEWISDYYENGFDSRENDDGVELR